MADLNSTATRNARLTPNQETGKVQTCARLNEDLFKIGGSITLSKARHLVCMEAVWEIEALAATLPTVTVNTDFEFTQSGWVVRGIAARIKELSNALGAGLHDEVVTTADLQNTVMVS